MSYLVLARKWRPKTFKDLVGQDAVSRTLENAINTNRIAHAFLFSGVRGVGKTSSARLLAKSLNCVKGPTVDPCCECSSCLEIATSSSLDVLEIDAASNTGVDNVRELRENARYSPSRDRFKIYIIDEVHMLSISAFNALLKTLEEPPSHVKFILATTELHKIPVTILSRCQHFEFRRIPAEKIQERLISILEGEDIKVRDGALAVISKAADGSLRDAISILDQVIAFSGAEITAEDVEDMLGIIDRDFLFALSSAIIRQDPQELMTLVGKLVEQGHDVIHFCSAFLEHIRDLLIIKVSKKPEELIAVSGKEMEMLENLSGELSEEDLIRFFDVLSDAENKMRWSKVPRFILETSLIKLIQIRRLAPIEDFLSKIGSGEFPRAVLRSQSSEKPHPPAGASKGKDSGLQIKAIIPFKRIEEEEEKPQPEKAKDDVAGIVDAIERDKPLLHGFLQQASTIEMEGVRLRIRFSKANDYFRDKVSGKENQDFITETASAVTGKNIEVSIEIAEPRESEIEELKNRDDEDMKKDKMLQEVKEEPLVQTIIDVFHGKILEVEKLD